MSARTPHLLAARCSAGDADAPYRHAELAISDILRKSFAADPRVWLSPEEGAVILQARIDTVWEHVHSGRVGSARAEAAHVGALAVRFVTDIYALGVERQELPRPRIREALVEVHAARLLVGPNGRALASACEGLGFLKREFDGLWAAILFDEPARDPAVRVAAAAVRFVAEVTEAVRPGAAAV